MLKKIILVSLLMMLVLPAMVSAGPCGDTGGDCYPTDCSGSDSVSGKALQATNAAANLGCSKAYGSNYVCCTQALSSGTGATKKGSSDSSAGGSGLLPAPGESKQSNSADDKGCPSGVTGNCGNYRINDLLVLGKNVTNWILGMVGSVSLLMFIWGGFQWLTSQGESAKIAEGKKIMTTAVVGIIIVFSSYIMVKFVVVDMLGMTWEGGYVNSDVDFVGSPAPKKP